MVEQIGKYEVSELIGHGGMADVYKVTNKGVSGFSKTLCIKRIRKQFVDRPEFVEMFETEARIVSHLQHDNIVQVYDFGRDESTRELFLVMEYIDGLDLDTILEIAGEYGTVSINFAVYVLESLLLALEHAHTLEVDGKTSSVIHRDISPHNILLSSSGSVKLADFGIAKAKGLSLGDETRTGVLKGKLSYMSPEQASGGRMPITPASDLFSAGVVFWEMITSKQLFNATMEHLVWGAMKVDESLLSDRSERLKRFVMGLLASDPAERLSSAAAALSALHRLGIRPCTKSDAARLVRKCKRDVEQVTWVSEHQSQAGEPASAGAVKGPPRTKRLEQSWAGTDRQGTGTAEETGSQGDAGAGFETSSTAVERPDTPVGRRRLPHPAMLIAVLSSAILIVLTLLWFVMRSKDVEGPEAPLLDEAAAGASAPAPYQNTTVPAKALAPGQPVLVKPAVSVRADDTQERRHDTDSEPAPEDRPSPAPRNQASVSPDHGAVKSEAPMPQDGVEPPPSRQGRKRKSKQEKSDKEEDALGTLIEEPFPLDVTTH